MSTICDKHKHYHISSDYGTCAFLHLSESPQTKENEIGKENTTTKKLRKGYIPVRYYDNEGQELLDGQRVYFTRIAAERQAIKIAKRVRAMHYDGGCTTVEVLLPS